MNQSPTAGPTGPATVQATAPVTIAVVGAGNRGQSYTAWVHAHPDRARIVAVADPLAQRRAIIAGGDETVAHFDDWHQLAALPRQADMVVISTQDHLHVEPALAFAAQGYAILLEKPIAPTEEECRRIVGAVQRAGVMFGVCHVLRYTPYTDLVRGIVDSGVLGRIMNVQHLEPVGWWHMAHSYVRGPWRREDQSSPMLLAKSCHDIDWLRYIVGQRIEEVSSFGALTHFRPECAPAGASDRCLTCPLEPTCPYSAPRLYVTALREQGATWPVSVITPGTGGTTTEADVVEALRTGPYGRCVYACDNTVVDHQEVAMRFAGGATASFTMTAFSEQKHRQTRIFGTHGCLEGDGESVEILNFRDGSKTRRDTGEAGSNAASGHGGGDEGLMDAFTAAIARGDASLIRSGAGESLESHLAVFAAEQARHAGDVRQVPAP